MRASGRMGALAGLIGALAVLTFPSSAAAGQTLLSDAFSGATTTSPVLAEPNPGTATHGLPCLTAGPDASSTPVPGCALGGAADALGSGVLRLTNTTGSESSSLIYNGSFPTSAGLDVTYDQYQYDGGGDGMSFSLESAPPVPAAGGGAGGGLGYAANGTGLAGMPFAYLGIGFDVFGNFSNTLTDGMGCVDPTWANGGRNPNQVVARGPGNGFTGYCLIAGTQAAAPDPMNGISLQGGTTRTGSERGVQILIDPTTDTFTVGIDPAGGTNYTTVLSGTLPSSYFDPASGISVPGLPPALTFALSAATGGVSDIQEISNLNAATLTPVLTLTATDGSGGAIKPGGAVTYQLAGGVSGASPIAETEPTTLALTDPLPAGEALAGTPSGAGWDCSASTAAVVSCAVGPTTAVAPGATLPPVSVPVTVSPSATTAVTNTASLVSADAAGPVSASDTIGIITSRGGGPVATTASVSCSPGTVLIGAVSTCTATVSDGASTTPSGTVQFTGAGGQFADGGSCTLAPVAGEAGAAACALADTVSASGTVTASYGGDAGHLGSTATTGVATAPVAGKTATVQVNSGVVLIHIPGHNGYVPLTSGSSSIPFGATIDALKGTVTLDTAADTLGAGNRHHLIQTGSFSEGLFTVKQAAAAAHEKARATEIDLETPPGAVVHAACRRTGAPGKGIVRTLNGVVKGEYRVVGEASTMTMSVGTFVVSDRCDGTLTKVRKGRAVVQYRRKVGHHTKTVSRTLHAGQELLAKERFLADTLAAG
jgi:large repetitive protein